MDFDKFRKDVEDIQRACWTQVIQQYFNKLSQGQIKTKAHQEDFQTIADVESEKFLTQQLTQLLPGSLVLGEEAEAAGSVSLDIFTQAKKDSLIWVIDPIDGTYNFVKGKDDFAIIIALVQNNETIGGWIYKPKTDEVVSAVKGRGAFVNGQPCHTSLYEDLVDLQGYSPLIYSSRAGVKGHFIQAAQAVDAIDNLRSSGVHYMNIAKGEADFYICHHSKPWDHLAGAFIVGESGGMTVQWDGHTYKPSDNKTMLVTANSQSSYKVLNDHFIKPIMKP